MSSKFIVVTTEFLPSDDTSPEGKASLAEMMQGMKNAGLLPRVCALPAMFGVEYGGFTFDMQAQAIFDSYDEAEVFAKAERGDLGGGEYEIWEVTSVTPVSPE